MKSLIDYFGESVNSEETPSSFQGMKEYWIQVVEKERGLRYQWSIKDQTLLSRLLKEYKAEDIVTMIDFYLKWNPISTFGAFFKSRGYVYQETHKPDDYGFN